MGFGERINSRETSMMVKIKKKRHWYPPPISLERMNPNSEKEETDIAEERAKPSSLFCKHLGTYLQFKQFLEEEDIL